METFALVHGAWHGARGWTPRVLELESRGHRAVAVDLPCDEVAAGIERYAEVVLEALRGVDDAVVVGHQPVEIEAGHSPKLSRPAELAALLAR